MSKSTNSGAAPSVEQLRMSCLLAAYRFEQQQAERGITPDRDKLSNPLSTRMFKVLAAVILSAIVGGMSLVGSFLVFNVILHLDF